MDRQLALTSLTLLLCSSCTSTQETDTLIEVDTGLNTLWSPPETVVVSAGGAHTCILDTTGSAHCFGLNKNDEASIPDGRYCNISAGHSHSCGLHLRGDIACSAGGYGVPTELEGPWSELTTGSLHFCVLDEDSDLHCEGTANGDWELHWPEGPFEQVDAGRSVDCALDAEHHLTCWGVDNGGLEDFGQVTGAPEGEYAFVSVGYNYFACVLDLEGEVQCWGDDTYGQLQAPEGPFVQLDAGGRHACALREDGSLACWGLDDPEDHYDGGQVRDTPTTGTWIQVSAGYTHTCAVRSDEKIVCWGRNEAGQCDVPEPWAP